MICTRVSSRRGKSQAVAERLPKITSTICEKMHMATSTLRAVAAVRKTSHGPAEGYALYPLIVLVLFWGAKGHDRTGKCWISGKPVVLLTLLVDMFNHERVFVDIVQPGCVEVTLCSLRGRYRGSFGGHKRTSVRFRRCR